jgi:hypothetical protein
MRPSSTRHISSPKDVVSRVSNTHRLFVYSVCLVATLLVSILVVGLKGGFIEYVRAALPLLLFSLHPSICSAF